MPAELVSDHREHRATAHIYVNTSTEAFKRNVFVALLQESMDADGNKFAEAEEFVPCREVAD